MIYNLDDLYVHILSERFKFEPERIESSAYYQCLVYKENRDKSFKIFKDYLDALNSRPLIKNIKEPRDVSYGKFLSLYRSIKDNSFNHELEPKIRLHNPQHRHCRDGRKLVKDGHHRVAILKYLGYNSISV